MTNALMAAGMVLVIGLMSIGVLLPMLEMGSVLQDALTDTYVMFDVLIQASPLIWIASVISTLIVIMIGIFES